MLCALFGLYGALGISARSTTEMFEVNSAAEICVSRSLPSREANSSRFVSTSRRNRLYSAMLSLRPRASWRCWVSATSSSRSVRNAAW